MATEYTETVDTFLKDTLPQLPGVMRSVAERELRLALREFFERSYTWTKVITGIDVPADEVPVQVDSGDINAVVIGFLGVAFNEIDLVPLPTRPSRSLTTGVPTRFYVTSNPDEICVYPYLDAPVVGKLDATVALTVQLSDTTNLNLPRQVTLKYYDAIIDGFLARMYMHPNKPYSAPQLAAFHRGRFLSRITYYIQQRKQGYAGAIPWAFPGGWGTRKVKHG